MGCGCKGGKVSPKNINQETGELNLRGKLLKVPLALSLTLFLVVLSPFILVMIWYLAFTSVLGKDQNLINLMLGRFIKKPKETSYIDEDEDEEFNEEDYEIVGVDIIK